MRHSGSDLGSLMHEADLAMYAAKAAGKNRVELFEPPPGNAALNERPTVIVGEPR
jgi:predicted signal transduction protein with EAL and GGDEF domain